MILKQFTAIARRSRAVFHDFHAFEVIRTSNFIEKQQSFKHNERSNREITSITNLLSTSSLISKSFSEYRNFTSEEQQAAQTTNNEEGKEAKKQRTRKVKTSLKNSIDAIGTEASELTSNDPKTASEEQQQVIRKRNTKKTQKEEDPQSILDPETKLTENESLAGQANTDKKNENISISAEEMEYYRTIIREEINKTPESSGPKKPKLKGSRHPHLHHVHPKRPITDNFELGDGKIQAERIKISSWNVNGLRAILSKGLLQSYLKVNDFDIICFNETKIDDAKLNNHLITDNFPPEYHLYFNCSKAKAGYSGTGIASKYKPISVLLDLQIEKHDQEGRAVTLEFEHFYLISCYVPNAGEGLRRLDYRTNEWDVELRKFVSELKKKKHVILCGDLNVAHQEIDLFDPKGNRNKSAGFTDREREGMTNLLNEGFVDTFRELYPKTVKYSWWSMRTGARKVNRGWRIDYFIIDKEGMKSVVDSTINNNIHGSDHCPVELIIDPNFS